MSSVQATVTVDAESIYSIMEALRNLAHRLGWDEEIDTDGRLHRIPIMGAAPTRVTIKLEES